jgi:hypothetical protein
VYFNFQFVKIFNYVINLPIVFVMLNQQLILPPKQSNIHNEILLCYEPVVIIGANGAGKSRFGLWIEENQVNLEKVHRISAQKSLDFPEYVQLKSLERAEKELIFGTNQDLRDWGGEVPTKKVNRWSNSHRPKLSVTPALDDYEKVLAVLFAKKSQRDSQLAKLVTQMERENIDKRPPLLISPHDTLLSIWKDFYPIENLLLKMAKLMF